MYVFGNTDAATFLGFLLLLNMSLGLAQDMRAWFALRNLQLLTAPHVTHVNPDGTESSVLVEDIGQGDRIKLSIGDQVPCDGDIIHAEALELNEGLITGESASLPKKEGDHILAGSVVTSGTALFVATKVFTESRIARMTQGIKSYSVSQSPIQQATGVLVRYAGYALVAAIAFVIIHDQLLGKPNILTVKEIGALAATIVPQGLMFAMTLLFAYGAAHLFRRNVLLQEVNATEKLGRIKNLCMDKTGTLTENMLVVEGMEVPTGTTHQEAQEATAAYLAGSGDSSQTVEAIRKYIPAEFRGVITDTTPFSSWRAYGAVSLSQDGSDFLIFAGAPERFLPFVDSDTTRAWLEQIVERETYAGKRVFCVMRAAGSQIPADISGTPLVPLAAFVFAAKLRPGIREAIEFFQDRGVCIRIISGDHPETVRSIAREAGVRDTERLTTGSAIEKWTREDYAEHAHEYTIFARTVPEQKEHIVEALRSNGFTAMVGDGANDALALKKADIGIAMWEGAPATRQIASVVLMNNSFTALPGGVLLADSIIKNAEIFAGIFLEFAFTGTFLFLMVSALGYPYPLSPLNIMLINYFAVGIPGMLVSYWTIRPASKSPAPEGKNFLRTVLPFTCLSGVLQAIAVGAIFLLSPEAMRTSGSDLYVLIASIVVGTIFFAVTPWFFRGTLTRSQIRELLIVLVVEAILFAAAFRIPLVMRFFEVPPGLPHFAEFAGPAGILVAYAALQSLLAYVLRKRS